MIPLKPSGQKALWCQPINDFVRCFVMLIGLLRFSISWIQFLKNTFPGKSSIFLKLKYINTWLRIWNLLSTQLYPVSNQCCFIPSLSFLLITAIVFFIIATHPKYQLLVPMPLFLFSHVLVSLIFIIFSLLVPLEFYQFVCGTLGISWNKCLIYFILSWLLKAVNFGYISKFRGCHHSYFNYF